MIIVIEGIDGSGKTTLAKYMAHRLGWQYRHYPYRLDSDLVKQNLQKAMAKDLLCNPPYRSQDWVLDRYLPSSHAYGMPSDLLDSLTAQLPKPDFSVLLDISAVMSVSRCQQRPDYDPLGYDLASVGKKQEIIDKYHELDFDLVINCNKFKPVTELYQLIASAYQSRRCCL